MGRCHVFRCSPSSPQPSLQSSNKRGSILYLYLSRCTIVELETTACNLYLYNGESSVAIILVGCYLTQASQMYLFSQSRKGCHGPFIIRILDFFINILILLFSSYSLSICASSDAVAQILEAKEISNKWLHNKSSRPTDDYFVIHSHSHAHINISLCCSSARLSTLHSLLWNSKIASGRDESEQ